ncbi:glycosyltransferase, partial [Patescibacteria group bacterium]
MKIGIDARFYGSLGKGLGRYVSELIAGLERLDRDNEYVVFLRRENYDEYEPQAPNFSKRLAEIPWYGWREQLLLPGLLKRERLDLMHFTHFNVPLLYRRPFVVTVHDLILLQHPTTRASTLGP